MRGDVLCESDLTFVLPCCATRKQHTMVSCHVNSLPAQLDAESRPLRTGRHVVCVQVAAGSRCSHCGQCRLNGSPIGPIHAPDVVLMDGLAPNGTKANKKLDASFPALSVPRLRASVASRPALSSGPAQKRCQGVAKGNSEATPKKASCCECHHYILSSPQRNGL